MIGKIIPYLRTLLLYSWRLKKFGAGSIIDRPLLFKGLAHISLGRRVRVRPGCRIEIVLRPDRAIAMPELTVGNNVNIEQGVHIVCCNSVVIGDQVSITPYVIIVDTFHPYQGLTYGEKIGDRLPQENTFVEIGFGTFIGAHAVILPNVRIGKYCVIGANSVVNSDVPDYTVVAGNPARPIKRFTIAAPENEANVSPQ